MKRTKYACHEPLSLEPGPSTRLKKSNLASKLKGNGNDKMKEAIICFRLDKPIRLGFPHNPAAYLCPRWNATSPTDGPQAGTLQNPWAMAARKISQRRSNVFTQASTSPHNSHVIGFYMDFPKSKSSSDFFHCKPYMSEHRPRECHRCSGQPWPLWSFQPPGRAIALFDQPLVPNPAQTLRRRMEVGYQGFPSQNWGLGVP